MSTPRLDFSNLLLLFSVAWFHIQYAALTIIARLCKTSFIIHHPKQTFPTIVSSPNDHTIYSMHPTPKMEEHIHLPPFQIPRRRHWLKTLDLLHFTARVRLPP